MARERSADERGRVGLDLSNRLSLRAKVLVPLVALFVLVEAASVAGALAYSQSAAWDDAIGKLERESGVAARRLNTSLQDRALAIEIAGKALESLEAGPQNARGEAPAEGQVRRDILPLLLASSNRGFERVIVTDANGWITADYRDGGLVEPPPGERPDNLEGDLCYRASASMRDVYVSPIGFAPLTPGDSYRADFPQVCVGRAIRGHDGGVVGVILGVADLTSDLALASGRGGSSTLLLSSASGSLGGADATRFIGLDPSAFPDGFENGDSVRVNIVSGGERYVAVATIARHVGGARGEDTWYAVSVASVRAISVESVGLAGRIAIASTFALLVIAGVVAVVLERAIRPVRALSEAAARVGAGDFRARVDVRSGDELEHLADSFNGMVAQLGERERRLQEHSRTLARSEKLAAIGTLAAGVAHEINNPLAFIKGNEQLADVVLDELERDPALSEKARADVGEVRESLRVNAQGVVRIERIVKSLRQFAKPSTQKQSVPIRNVVDATLALAQNRLRSSKVDVETEFPADLPNVLVNPDEIGQVVLNLVVNAVDAHSGRAGRVKLSARAKSGYVSLDVADAGDGIPEHIARNLFTPFVTTKSTGTGLGLSISHRIVEEHGGTMSFQSTPGQGTTFTITLPVVGPQAVLDGSLEPHPAAVPGVGRSAP